MKTESKSDTKDKKPVKKLKLKKETLRELTKEEAMEVQGAGVTTVTTKCKLA